MLGVILIHTQPFRVPRFDGTMYRLLADLLHQASRFAVPFFFMVSGYFFASKIKAGGSPGRLFAGYARRLLVVVLAWYLIYVVALSFLPDGQDAAAGEGLVGRVSGNVLYHTDWIGRDPFSYLWSGPSFHLWFLPSLLAGLGVVALLVRCGLRRWLLLVVAPLYLLRLLTDSYARTPLGLHIPLQTYTFDVAFSATFVAIGFWLADHEVRPPLAIALVCLLGGFLMQITEASLLARYFGADPLRHACLAGTLFFVTGVFLVALARPNLGRSTPLPSAGRYSLGIYASHLLVLAILTSLSVYSHPMLWEIGLPLVVYLGALALSVAFSRIPKLRELVV